MAGTCCSTVAGIRDDGWSPSPACENLPPQRRRRLPPSWKRVEAGSFQPVLVVGESLPARRRRVRVENGSLRLPPQAVLREWMRDWPAEGFPAVGGDSVQHHRQHNRPEKRKNPGGIRIPRAPPCCARHVLGVHRAVSNLLRFGRRRGRGQHDLLFIRHRATCLDRHLGEDCSAKTSQGSLIKDNSSLHGKMHRSLSLHRDE